MLTTFLFVLYVIIALIIVVSLLINGVRPSKTLAWLLAIFTIPVGGILLYLMTGRNRRKNKLLQLPKDLLNPSIEIFEVPNLPEKHKKLSRLIFKTSGFPVTNGNTLLYLKDGKTTFEAIFIALENATEFIHFQYYIFEEGELADRLLDLFDRKIQDGIKIRLIYDGIGSFSLSRSYLKKLKSSGVEVFSFLPFKFGRFLSSLNYRNHRKIIVIDGTVAFSGGINVSDKYLKGDPVLGKWHDMHLKIEGPAVTSLNHIFLIDWQLVGGPKIGILKEVERESSGKGKSIVQVVSSGPDKDFPAIEQLYFSIINQAQNYLYITNPYIIPGYAIMTALETAALSGIDVRLMVSEKNDSNLVNWSVRSYFEPLLKAGVKIHLFHDGFLHSKIMISDDDIISIGTANIDIRSFEQNYEVNTIVYDADFVKELKEDFLIDCENSHELTYSTHKKRPWLDKLKEGIAKIFSPIL
ncbi:Cardiolipin synthetase [hydrothermal vent metagenome]|uniref:Cardiolipin synthetase n=1 Tax=hydrothermal vent metagenome TaxID=652676 RepID=A0A3B0TDF5_9ZZZZ